MRPYNIQAHIIRRSLRRIYQTIRFGTLRRSPIFFANSFPKSGTHLLTQVLRGMSRIGPAVDSGLPAVVTYDGFTGRKRSFEEVLNDLQRLLPADIAYGHVHSFQQAVELLCQSGWASCFILRDPRDVAVSHVHYIAKMATNHIHHRYYHDVLPGFSERLEASITGVPVEKLQEVSELPVLEPLPDLYQRFSPYLGWLEQPQVLVLRYEEFINDRQATLANVFDYSVSRGFEPAVQRGRALEILAESINPRLSPTFRSGKTGAWREVFSQHHLQLMSRITGDLIERLGYEVSELA